MHSTATRELGDQTSEMNVRDVSPRFSLGTGDISISTGNIIQISHVLVLKKSGTELGTDHQKWGLSEHLVTLPEWAFKFIGSLNLSWRLFLYFCILTVQF